MGLPAAAFANGWVFERSLFERFAATVTWQNPAVSGRWVVCQERSGAPGSHWNLRAVDPRTGASKVVATFAFDMDPASVDGDWVAWYQPGGGVRVKNVVTDQVKILYPGFVRSP